MEQNLNLNNLESGVQSLRVLVLTPLPFQISIEEVVDLIFNSAFVQVFLDKGLKCMIRKRFVKPFATAQQRGTNTILSKAFEGRTQISQALHTHGLKD